MSISVVGYHINLIGKEGNRVSNEVLNPVCVGTVIDVGSCPSFAGWIGANDRVRAVDGG